MSRECADLTCLMLANDYDPAHYLDWTDEEIKALGNVKSVAEVLKKRLVNNSLQIQGMYAVEHKGEKANDSQAPAGVSIVDQTKKHYHIVVKFAPRGGATLAELADYMGISPQIIEKPKTGRYSYDNMMAYLIHIKYKDKLQYAPEKVVTLAGPDYVDYYNAHVENWRKARNILIIKKRKPQRHVFKEAVAKMKGGELNYSELFGIEEYRKLLFMPKFQKELEKISRCVCEVAREDEHVLIDLIERKEITALEEITENERWKLAYKYYSDEIQRELNKAWRKALENDYHDLIDKCKNKEIISLDEIAESEEWKLVYKYYSYELKTACVPVWENEAKQEFDRLKFQIEQKQITSLEEIAESGDWKLAYEYRKDDIKSSLEWAARH